jgi:hypothetical protein
MLVKREDLVVVRDRIELSTFRFSGALSPRDHTHLEAPNSPAHAHPRWSPAVLRAFNTHNKCTGVCRFVRGIPVGIGYGVAGLWGFCGARRSADLPSLPDTRCRGYRNSGG